VCAASSPVRPKKRLGIDVVSEKGADGVRGYFVATLKS
jgi:hypothetical protein